MSIHLALSVSKNHIFFNPKGTDWGLYRPRATLLARHFLLGERCALKIYEFVTKLVIYNVEKTKPGYLC